MTELRSGKPCAAVQKKWPLFLALLTFTLFLRAGTAFCAQDNFPQPKGAVNDFAGVVEAAEARQMEALAREVWEKTGTAIVVAVLETIGDQDPQDYANRLYQAWGIGEKGKDKGVLVFLALKERKIRIETGYGVEGILPDGLVGEILDKYVLPYLKEGKYGQGLANGCLALASVIAQDARVTLSGTPAPVQPRGKSSRRNIGLFPIILLLLVLIPLLGTRQGRAWLPVILLMLLGSGRGRGGGGGYGGGMSGGFGGGFGGFGGGFSGGGGAGRSF